MIRPKKIQEDNWQTRHEAHDVILQAFVCPLCGKRINDIVPQPPFPCWGMRGDWHTETTMVPVTPLLRWRARWIWTGGTTPAGRPSQRGTWKLVWGEKIEEAAPAEVRS
jgi:hypothetical protein